MKIYDAAILALKEIGKPATTKDILKSILNNGWYSFKTPKPVTVLTHAIRRHMIGYTGLQASEQKYFGQQGNKYFLLEEVTEEPIQPSDQIEIEWKIKRNSFIEEIRAIFQRDQLSLFLGSGVSTSAGFPSWESLLEKLNAAVFKLISSSEYKGKLASFQIIEAEKEILINVLGKLRDDSPIINAYFLESTLNSRSIISKCIRDALYGKRKRMFTSDTLKWIAKLCNHRGKYRIRSVVTLNYDDLLEQHLAEVPVDYIPVFKEDDEINPNVLPIFHVHGYLPQKDSSFDDKTENLIVFSEQAYHRVYNDAYSWSNIIQLYVLKENVCLVHRCLA